MLNRRKKLKVMTIVGTRPELVRLSRTIALLDENLDQVLVHTGQNYDYELNQVFFDDLEIRKPDYFLGVNVSSLGKMMGDLLIKAEEVLLAENPDAVLILGDTNSSIAGLMAKRYRIPLYHMEAGNRCFDLNVPEEINRRIVDHIADFNLVYTEHARRHLLAEGIQARRIYLTGSPMNEVLSYYSDKIAASTILQRVRQKPFDYFLISMHREENVDFLDPLQQIVANMNRIASEFGKTVLVSTHPRTRKRLKALKSSRISQKVKLFKPFGFFDYVKLEQNAICTISDSGTIAEEASIASFPAITMRNSFERPEALDAGSIMLTGLDQETVVRSIRLAMKEREISRLAAIPQEYTIRDTSWRVLKLITGTFHLSNKWHGMYAGERV